MGSAIHRLSVYGLAAAAQAGLIARMPSKTISLELTSYERLVATRRPGESFSSVIDRITPPAPKGTAADLLRLSKSKAWGKGVDWKQVGRAVSNRRRSRDLRPSP